MIQLGSCSRCKGFLGIAVNACPHCGMALGRARKILAGLSGLAGGGAVSATLMACYGGACIDSAENDCMYVGDGGHEPADARVNPIDAGVDAKQDASVDASSDAALDARLDASSDASFDAADGD